MLEQKATAKCQAMHETIQRHHTHALQAEKPVTSSPLLDIGTAYQTAETMTEKEGGTASYFHSSPQPKQHKQV